MTRIERSFETVAKKLLRDARYRASKKNQEFSIDYDFVLNKLSLGRCEQSGVFLSMVAGDPFAPSLDRHDNDRGYDPANTMLVCHMYNKAAANWPKGHLMAFCCSYVEFNKLALIAALKGSNS